MYIKSITVKNANPAESYTWYSAGLAFLTVMLLMYME
jgi:hypothetical protein